MRLSITESRKRRGKRKIEIEASHEWVAWLDRLAEHTGADRSTTVERALIHLATKSRYTHAPPKR